MSGEKLNKRYTLGEEIFNAVSHGAGGLLSIAGTVVLIVLCAVYSDAWSVISACVYGASLIILYTMSTLYHAITNEKAKKFFRVMDHNTIFFLIAGTYTPFTLVTLRGKLGWILFGIVWGSALIGIILNSIDLEKFRKPSVVCYILMGWVIIIAVIVCVGVAVCFLTNPKQDRYTLRIVVPAGSQEEFVYTEEEVSTVRNSIKIWSGDGLGDTEVLLFPVNKTAETGYTATYLTHGMPVEFDAEKDTWFKIGVNMQNPTNEDIIVYVEVENVEVRIVDEINSVIEWFDYLETPDEMKWDGSLEISLTEFPDVTFRWTYGEMLAVKGSKSTSLYTGMPIWNAYFCDLTGDGLPELCSSISWGSGMIDNRVIIYDYANGVSYELSDRGYFDFTLRQDHQDGRLYVDKTKYHTDELVETGRLVFKNHCIQIEGFSNEAHQVFQAEILEICDGNYLVKPVEGSWELSSADRIEVPIRNAHPSQEPEIGDVIEIEYSGEILETYPARIADVYSIKVVAEKESQGDR